MIKKDSRFPGTVKSTKITRFLFCLLIPTNAKTKLLIPVQCSLFDTNSRRRINVALFVSFRATKNYKVSVAVKTCFQLPNCQDVIFGIYSPSSKH